MKYLIPTSQAEHSAKKLIDLDEDIEIIIPDRNKKGRRHFPDGEVYTKISRLYELSGNEVTVIHCGAPRDGLVELLTVLNIVNPYSSQTNVFFTYPIYSRQDKEFEKGERNIAEDIIRLVEDHQAYNIYTIDAHFKNRGWTENHSIKDYSALDILKNKVLEDYPTVQFIAPDEGSSRRTGLDHLIKHRIDDDTVELKMPTKIKRRIRNRPVCIVDDMIGTGTTLCDSFDLCKDTYASEVVAAATHGVNAKGVNRVRKKYDNLYLGNTINKRGANVDVTTPLILEAHK